MDELRVTYHLDVDPGAAEARAEEVALEQTVEVPDAVVRDPFVASEVRGRVASVEADPAGGARAVLDYPLATTCFEPAQLLNVVFGNSSLHADVRCVDLEVPRALRDALGGPRFGIEGLRDAVGVHGRPLTCTAIKPMGLSTEALAELCFTFARAGIDVIKDDHGIGDQEFSRFEQRVPACLDAVRRAADETGREVVYAPNLIGTPDRIARSLDHAVKCGARAVLVSPMLVGMPVFWQLCQERSPVPVVAHPAFAGALRIDARALFGRIFRLFGADAVIYVNFGSRFAQSREASRELAEALVAEWGGVRPSLPVPAGGIRLENAAEVAAFYGRDVMLLIGGSLQLEEDAVYRRSREFVEAVTGGDAG